MAEPPMSSIAAFRQKLEADAAAAAAKGATPTLMPVNEKKDLREWKRNGNSTSINNGNTPLTPPPPKKLGAVTASTTAHKPATTTATANKTAATTAIKPATTTANKPAATTAIKPAAIAATKSAGQSSQHEAMSPMRRSSLVAPSLPSTSGPMVIPSTPSEAKKKLGSAAANSSPNRKFKSSVKPAPITPPFGGAKPTVGQSRASFAFTMAKPSDIRAVMQKEKGKHETTNLNTKSNTIDTQRTASPARGQNDEDDELMAVVRKSNHFNSKRQSVVSQMAESFVHLDLRGAESNGASSLPNKDKDGRPAPMKRNLETSISGSFRRMGSIRALNGGTGPSNRVPEMRRRAAPQDLMFAEEEGVNDKSVGDLGSLGHDSKDFSLSNLKFGDIPKSKKGDNAALDAKEHHKQLQKEVVAQRRQEQEEKLTEAKKAFQQGHDLCWQENDSVGALAKYRVALYVRESLLGKYHEDTGRTYYWIGRSLIKLRDFEEALVAFSRALRIFERTLFSKHKYNKWASGSIDTCFQEMGVNDAARDEYKTHLNASIQYERSGDQLRKSGRFPDAIVEYRNGIDTIEEYNPDAADLYCKIAMIYRAQGEFDKALEEYRMASKIYQLSLGAEHPDTVKTLSQLIEKKRMNQLSLALQEKLDLNRP